MNPFFTTASRKLKAYAVGQSYNSKLNTTEAGILANFKGNCFFFIIILGVSFLVLGCFISSHICWNFYMGLQHFKCILVSVWVFEYRYHFASHASVII